MATISLLLTADDKASPVLKRLGDSAKKIGAGMAAGAAVAGAAAVAFGIDSVKAYAESEQSQARLADAFARFPKLADTNLESLQKLNSELAKKTRFDDDATASAQAVLAQFELTGDQIMKLTPLVQDYAAKTGKDLPTAAEDLGKAIMGQGRALKEVGIDFEDTGTQAGNFEQLVGSLSEKVGGFAAVEGETAAGKLEILRNRFGEVQEKIGGALMPALDGLVEWLNGDGMTTIEGLADWIEEEAIPGFQGLVDWVVKYKDILGPAAGAIGVLTGAQWLLNAAMAANPVGLVIAGITAIIALGAAVATNFMNIQNTLYTVSFHTQKFMTGIALNFAGFIEGMINTLIDGLNTVLGFFGMGKVGKVDLTSGLRSNWIITSNNLLAGMAGGLAGAEAQNAGGGGRQGGSTRRTGGMPRLAEGGAVMSATIALIGEGGEPEAVVPFSKIPEFAERLGYGAARDDVAHTQPPVVNVYIDGNLSALDGFVTARIEHAERDSVMTVKRGYQRR